MPNPILPFNEYIPDVEAHDCQKDRYLFGSHDKEDGERFCMLDYVLYSASIYDLSKWTYHGIIYKKKEDPRSKLNKLADYYAPDIAIGNDNKFYLYYVAMGPNTTNFGPISVAISDNICGPYKYFHDVTLDNKPLLKYLNNDPTILNDNGKIYLYYGWGLGRDFSNKLFRPLFNLVESKLFNRSIKEIKKTKPSILSCAFVELKSNMYEAKSDPIAILDSKTTANKKSILYKHAFYEAPSIRKIKNLYYLIYSSNENNELCYATSLFPNKNFVYRGVIISNTDMNYKGNKKAFAFGGTIHGSIENINNKYYVFYHRLTRNSNFSRQVCAERIEIDENGGIKQVEMTSIGLDDKPLKTLGTYSSYNACNIYHKSRITRKNEAMYSKDDDNNYIIKNIKNGFIIGYKYFDFKNDITLIVTLKGSKGKIKISDGNHVFYKKILKSKLYKDYEIPINFKGIKPLYIEYIGFGSVDLLEIKFK